MCVCVILHCLDSYSWTVSFHRLSCFAITSTDTFIIAAAVGLFRSEPRQLALDRSIDRWIDSQRDRSMDGWMDREREIDR